MIPQSPDEFAKLLIGLKLVTPEGIRECSEALTGFSTSQDLLNVLERRDLLTTFQTARLQKGEIEGLVLGGCILQYRNASGSFARVYRGRRISNGEMVGVKVLRDRWSNDPDTVQLFRREGEFGKRLKHPNIVPIHEVGSEGRIHYIIMEFVEGGNLRDFIKIRKKLEASEACRYGLDMSRALQYALSQGVTHRDFKATNVLLSSQGVAKLIDFGLAAEDSFLNRNSSPDLAQAIEYSTLEKNTNAPRNDPRSDLFFLGTILYELIAGEPPYPRTRDREERRQFSRYRNIRPLSMIAPSVPPRVSAIVDRLLQVDPSARYQSPAEVVRDLENVLQELGHPAKPLSGATSSSTTASNASSATTLLCVEHRPKRQDILREYFTKHGYRLLLLGDADRALSRLKSSPPQGIVFFGDAIGNRIVEDFQSAIDTSKGSNIAVVAVLSESQEALADRLKTTDPRGIVLSPPVRLRDLREQIEKVLKPAT